MSLKVAAALFLNRLIYGTGSRTTLGSTSTTKDTAATTTSEDKNVEAQLDTKKTSSVKGSLNVGKKNNIFSSVKGVQEIGGISKNYMNRFLNYSSFGTKYEGDNYNDLFPCKKEKDGYTVTTYSQDQEGNSVEITTKITADIIGDDAIFMDETGNIVIDANKVKKDNITIYSDNPSVGIVILNSKSSINIESNTAALTVKGDGVGSVKNTSAVTDNGGQYGTTILDVKKITGEVTNASGIIYLSENAILAKNVTVGLAEGGNPKGSALYIFGDSEFGDDDNTQISYNIEDMNLGDVEQLNSLDEDSLSEAIESLFKGEDAKISLFYKKSFLNKLSISDNTDFAANFLAQLKNEDGSISLKNKFSYTEGEDYYCKFENNKYVFVRTVTDETTGESKEERLKITLSGSQIKFNDGKTPDEEALKNIYINAATGTLCITNQQDLASINCQDLPLYVSSCSVKEDISFGGLGMISNTNVEGEVKGTKKANHLFVDNYDAENNSLYVINKVDLSGGDDKVFSISQRYENTMYECTVTDKEGSSYNLLLAEGEIDAYKQLAEDEGYTFDQGEPIRDVQYVQSGIKELNLGAGDDNYYAYGKLTEVKTSEDQTDSESSKSDSSTQSSNDNSNSNSSNVSGGGGGGGGSSSGGNTSSEGNSDASSSDDSSKTSQDSAIQNSVNALTTQWKKEHNGVEPSEETKKELKKQAEFEADVEKQIKEKVAEYYKKEGYYPADSLVKAWIAEISGSLNNKNGTQYVYGKTISVNSNKSKDGNVVLDITGSSVLPDTSDSKPDNKTDDKTTNDTPKSDEQAWKDIYKTRVDELRANKIKEKGSITKEEEDELKKQAEFEAKLEKELKKEIENYYNNVGIYPDNTVIRAFVAKISSSLNADMGTNFVYTRVVSINEQETELDENGKAKNISITTAQPSDESLKEDLFNNLYMDVAGEIKELYNSDLMAENRESIDPQALMNAKLQAYNEANQTNYTFDKVIMLDLEKTEFDENGKIKNVALNIMNNENKTGAFSDSIFDEKENNSQAEAKKENIMPNFETAEPELTKVPEENTLAPEIEEENTFNFFQMPEEKSAQEIEADSITEETEEQKNKSEINAQRDIEEEFMQDDIEIEITEDENYSTSINSIMEKLQNGIRI